MSDLVVQGKVVGIKPRGSKGGFWTVEIDDGSDSKYPMKLSLNQFDREDNPTGFYELVQDAMGTGDTIEAEYYETEGEYQGKPVTYRNGTKFTYPQASEGAESNGARPAPTPSSASSENSVGAGESKGGAATSSPLPVAPAPSGNSDRTPHIESAWSISQAIALLSAQGEPFTKDAVHTVAHELLVLKNRVASEL